MQWFKKHQPHHGHIEETEVDKTVHEHVCGGKEAVYSHVCVSFMASFSWE